MSHPRTFRTDKLYHQFLKPAGVPLECLTDFVTELHCEGFIVPIPPEGEDASWRYYETKKLTSGDYKDDLFKLIGTFR